MNALHEYLKLLWIHHGFYNHYSHTKFVPFSLTPDGFRAAVETAAAGGASPVVAGETLSRTLSRLERTIFDSELEPVQTNQSDGADIVATSAVNFWDPGIRQEEIDKLPPEWRHRLNVRYARKNGGIEPEVYKIGGLYGDELETISHFLALAHPLAEDDHQRKIDREPARVLRDRGGRALPRPQRPLAQIEPRRRLRQRLHRTVHRPQGRHRELRGERQLPRGRRDREADRRERSLFRGEDALARSIQTTQAGGAGRPRRQRRRRDRGRGAHIARGVQSSELQRHPERSREQERHTSQHREHPIEESSRENGQRVLSSRVPRESASVLRCEGPAAPDLPSRDHRPRLGTTRPRSRRRPPRRSRAGLRGSRGMPRRSRRALSFVRSETRRDRRRLGRRTAARWSRPPTSPSCRDG